jgi:hypothetical protein
LAIVDGYPDYQQLLAPVLGYSPQDLPAMRAPIAAALQLASAFEPFGLTRVIPSAATFQPHSLAGTWLANYNNGRSWRAQWLMFTGQDNTEALAAAAGPSAQPYNAANGLTWPQLAPHIRVLITPASSTVWSNGAPDPNKKIAWAYWQQALLYNSTLSPVNASSLHVCYPCTHAIPSENGSDWLAPRLAQWFST